MRRGSTWSRPAERDRSRHVRIANAIRIVRVVPASTRWAAWVASQVAVSSSRRHEPRCGAAASPVFGRTSTAPQPDRNPRYPALAMIAIQRFPTIVSIPARRDRCRPVSIGELRLGTLGESDHRTNTGVQIALTEGFLERGKLRLARAVARRNLIQLPLVAQDTRHALNLSVGRPDQMKPAEEQVDVFVDRAGHLQDALDTGMRAAVQENQPLRAPHSHRQLAQLERPGNVGNGG